jgi:hypothetical protein
MKSNRPATHAPGRIVTLAERIQEMKPTRCSLIVAGIIAVLILNFSASSSGDSKMSTKEREKAVFTLDEFYAKFLSGTLVEARSSLEKAVAFIHGKSILIPELQSSLPICYARFSLLERKAGNDAQSRIYFEKSRYWRIIEREKLGHKPEEIIANHEAFTRDESDNYALEWDKKWTKGEGPAYLKELK